MKKLLIILFALFCITGCGSLKKHFSTNTTDNIEKTNKSEKTNVSEPIKDKLVINVPKSDNEATNKLLENVLQQLNTSKTSGSNSYRSTYDAETRQLVIDFIVAQSKIQETNVTSEKSLEQRTDEYIERKIKRIPWWIYALVGLYFLPKIIDFVFRIIKMIKPV